MLDALYLVPVRSFLVLRPLPLLQVFVQILVPVVVLGLVGQVAACRFQFGGRLAPYLRNGFVDLSAFLDAVGRW